MNCKDEIELIIPSRAHKEQVENYMNEHFEIGQFWLNGTGGLHHIKNFDQWIEVMENNPYYDGDEKEGIFSTVYLGVRKSDNKIIGMVQIRHSLNERLLKNIGNIGDGVRPSERKKGYASELIRLALIECQKIGLKRVLMCCYDDNIGSKKSIIKNGGILENEIISTDGKIEQRYWISLNKAYSNDVKSIIGVEEVEQYKKTFNNEEFNGDLYFNYFKKVSTPLKVRDGKTIIDEGYKWLEFYNYDSKVRLTAIYDSNNEIVEWYFDIARMIGKENDVSFVDDMFLDILAEPQKEPKLLYEDEFKESYKRLEMTKKEHDEAYELAYNLINKLKEKNNDLLNFTNKYLNYMLLEE